MELSMLIKIKRGWEIPERDATPEALFLNRREIVKAMGMGAILSAGASALPLTTALAADADADPSAGLYPAKRNEKYTLDRPVTDEKLSTNYNNFYEYGEDKEVASRAQQLKVRPWTIEIDGIVDADRHLRIDHAVDLDRPRPDLQWLRAAIEGPAVDDRDRRHGRCEDDGRHRRSLEEDATRGATLPPPLRRSLVDGCAVERFSAEEPRRSRKAAVEREISANDDLHGQQDGAGTENVLVSVALRRRPHDGGSDQRSRFHGHGHVWPSGAEARWRPAAPRDTVEIRLQVDQIDRQIHLHR